VTTLTTARESSNFKNSITRILDNPYMQEKKTVLMPQGTTSDFVSTAFVLRRSSLEKIAATIDSPRQDNNCAPGHEIDNSRMRSDYFYKQSKPSAGFYNNSHRL
jgi:hypothetical protein